MARFSRRRALDQSHLLDRRLGWLRAGARKRLLRAVVDRKVPGVVVLGGDVHAHYVTDLKVDYDDARAPTIATESLRHVDHKPRRRAGTRETNGCVTTRTCATAARTNAATWPVGSTPARCTQA